MLRSSSRSRVHEWFLTTGGRTIAVRSETHRARQTVGDGTADRAMSDLVPVPRSGAVAETMKESAFRASRCEHLRRQGQHRDPLALPEGSDPAFGVEEGPPHRADTARRKCSKLGSGIAGQAPRDTARATSTCRVLRCTLADARPSPERTAWAGISDRTRALSAVSAIDIIPLLTRAGG